MLFETRYTEVCCGHNAFWVHCRQLLDLSNGHSADAMLWGDGFEIEIETVINTRIAKDGLDICEVKSFEFARVHCVSNLNAVTGGLRVLRAICIERLSTRRGHSVVTGCSDWPDAARPYPSRRPPSWRAPLGRRDRPGRCGRRPQARHRAPRVIGDHGGGLAGRLGPAVRDLRPDRRAGRNWGLSMGTLYGLPFLAREDRVQAAVPGPVGIGPAQRPTSGPSSRQQRRRSAASSSPSWKTSPLRGLGA